MFRFWFTLLRELRLLIRDRAGMLLLFVMPAALVVVITLVQDNVFKDHGGTQLAGLVVDHDDGPASRDLIRRLEQVPLLSLERAIDGQPLPPLDSEGLRRAVQAGRYRFGVVLPEGFSTFLQGHAEASAGRVFDAERGTEEAAGVRPEMILYLDPTMTGGYRAAVDGALRQAAAAMQMRLQTQALERVLNERIAQLNESFAESPGAPYVPPVGLDVHQDPWIRITTAWATIQGDAALPTAVQQNVPAWALFGMFFVAVPLAGGMIRERQQGIADRLMTMPLSILTVSAGKLSAYVGVCLAQFVLIVAVGRWLMPVLGAEALVMGGRYGAIVLVVLCSALAAAGFGVMLGSLARTYEQATTLGPIAVVIAAALGGLMVPVFAMPAAMQHLSRISPLAWGHDALLTIFVRNGDMSAVSSRMVALLLFFVGTLIISRLFIRRS